MNLVALGIMAGAVLLLVLKILGLHKEASVYASRALMVLAFIVIFLVGVLTGGGIRAPSLALSIILLGLAMSITSILASLLAASLLLRLRKPSKQVDRESLEKRGPSGTFTSLRALVVMALGWALGLSLPSLSGGGVGAGPLLP